MAPQIWTLGLGALRNLRIFYAYFGILCNLPSKKISPSFLFFTFFPIFSRRHLPPPVSGVDAPANNVQSVQNLTEVTPVDSNL